MRILAMFLLCCLATGLWAEPADTLVCKNDLSREQLTAVLRNLYLSVGQSDLAWVSAADSLDAGTVCQADIVRAFPADEEIVILTLNREQLHTHFGSSLDPGEAYIVRVALGEADAQEIIERFALPDMRIKRTGKRVHEIVRHWLRP
ncbi:MAG: hypothetical protein K8R90_01525 [Candidatus Cloacimonetes bacterium]|nr:hypothetical protein [Candidatus Cloacimonadota bacterium]